MKKPIEKKEINNYYNECYRFSLNFIKKNKFFSSEDLKEAYLLANKPQPSEPRVWGSVIVEIKKQGLIKKGKMSTYKNPVGHGKPINTWVSLIAKV